MSILSLPSLIRIAVLAAVALAAALVAQPAAAQTTVSVDVGDVWFCEASFQNGVCDTTIAAGDTVRWDFGPATLPHTATACGASCDSQTGTPLFDSGLRADGSTYEYTFTDPGTYLYYCVVHPTAQRGRIIVQGDVPVTANGDVNCNGSTDSIDAALVLQLGAGLLSSLSCEENADVNEDGNVNSIDSALILQHTAGLLLYLPV